MKQFHIETSLTEDMAVLTLSGELDASSSLKADTTLIKTIETGIKSLLINCQELTYISSAGLGVFLANFQACRMRNIRLVFYGMKPKIRNVFEMVGLQHIFSIVNSYEDAVSAALS